MENTKADFRKYFKPHHIIVYLVYSVIIGWHIFDTAERLGGNPAGYPLRILVVLALFAVQMIFLVGNCKYTYIVNTSRDCEKYKNKWYFYAVGTICVSQILLLLFEILFTIRIMFGTNGNPLITLIICIIPNLAIFSLLFWSSFKNFTKAFISFRVTMILKKYGRTEKAVSELKKIKTSKYFFRKDSDKLMKTYILLHYDEIGDFKSAYEILNIPNYKNGQPFHKVADFRHVLSTALMANDIPFATEVFNANRNQLLSMAEKDPISQYILGIWNYVHNDFPNSIIWLEKFLETSRNIARPDFQIYIDLANSYLSAGNSETAKNYADKAEELIENDYDRWRMERFKEKYQAVTQPTI